MAIQQWKTVSIRLTEDEENALKLLCEKRNKKKHSVLKKLLLNELEPILKPGKLAEGEGIPLVGEHIFKYNSVKDNFTWQIDLGVHGVHALAEDVPFTFLENLNKSIEKATDERKKIRIPRKKTRVPKSMLKYKVK